MALCHSFMTLVDMRFKVCVVGLIFMTGCSWEVEAGKNKSKVICDVLVIGGHSCGCSLF